MIYSTIIIVSIFSIFYASNQTFQNRIDTTISKIHNTDLSEKAKDMKNTNRTSIGCRIGFWYNSFDIIKKNPLLGVGTGDSAIAMERHLSTSEYKKLKTLCGLKVNRHFNSHNLYISMLLLFGIPGLMVLIYSFYLQIRVALLYSSQTMLILIIPTMITMLSQSSLFTSHYFIAFYAYMLTILYLQEKQNKQEI
jgi:O-antigen ligase